MLQEFTELHTWFERDRAHVELRCAISGETIVEWRDDAVGEAIEDGFLDPSDYHGSAMEYAEYHDIGKLTWTVCYDIVTYESAEHGDFAEHGYCVDGGWKYPLNNADYPTTLEDAKNGVFDRRGSYADMHRDAEKYGVSLNPDADWLYSVDPEENYQTGENTTYSLHIQS